MKKIFVLLLYCSLLGLGVLGQEKEIFGEPILSMNFTKIKTADNMGFGVIVDEE